MGSVKCIDHSRIWFTYVVLRIKFGLTICEELAMPLYHTYISGYFASIPALLYVCVILRLTLFLCFLFLVLENVDIPLEQDPNSDSQVSAIQPGTQVLNSS